MDVEEAGSFLPWACESCLEMSGAAPEGDGKDSQAGNMGYPGAHCARYPLGQALGHTKKSVF